MRAVELFPTARLGYAANNWLFYVKGGGAWAEGSSSGKGMLASGTPFDTTSSGSIRAGWIVGGGVEWGFAPNWSAMIEYNYLDFGSRTVTINNSLGITTFVNSFDTVNIVKAGVNHRFNFGSPMVARY